MNNIAVLGMDPSMNNWGLCHALLDLDSMTLSDLSLDVIQPVKPTGKSLAVLSKDMAVAHQLVERVLAECQDKVAIFTECQTGTQSARGAVGYGMTTMLTAALKHSGFPIYPLTPTNVKMAAVGKQTATKREMIGWARERYPDANWPMQTQKGVTSIIESKAEHMADAIAAIHAGIASDTFKQVMALRAA